VFGQCAYRNSLLRSIFGGKLPYVFLSQGGGVVLKLILLKTLGKVLCEIPPTEIDSAQRNLKQVFLCHF